MYYDEFNKSTNVHKFICICRYLDKQTNKQKIAFISVCTPYVVDVYEYFSFANVLAFFIFYMIASQLFYSNCQFRFVFATLYIHMYNFLCVCFIQYTNVCWCNRFKYSCICFLSVCVVVCCYFLISLTSCWKIKLRLLIHIHFRLLVIGYVCWVFAVYSCIFLYRCMYVCMRVYMYVCICVYIYAKCSAILLV